MQNTWTAEEKKPAVFLSPIHLSFISILHHLQVLDGAGLDVDFTVFSPSGQLLFSDYRKSDGVHT